MLKNKNNLKHFTQLSNLFLHFFHCWWCFACKKFKCYADNRVVKHKQLQLLFNL